VKRCNDTAWPFGTRNDKPLHAQEQVNEVIGCTWAMLGVCVCVCLVFGFGSANENCWIFVDFFKVFAVTCFSVSVLFCKISVSQILDFLGFCDENDSIFAIFSSIQSVAWCSVLVVPTKTVESLWIFFKFLLSHVFQFRCYFATFLFFKASQLLDFATKTN